MKDVKENENSTTLEKYSRRRNKRIIPDKFGYWFAENLPQFFSQGVSIRQIQEAMPKKLFEEYCKHNDILFCDDRWSYF